MAIAIDSKTGWTRFEFNKQPIMMEKACWVKLGIIRVIVDEYGVAISQHSVQNKKMFCDGSIIYRTDENLTDIQKLSDYGFSQEEINEIKESFKEVSTGSMIAFRRVKRMSELLNGGKRYDRN